MLRRAVLVLFLGALTTPPASQGEPTDAFKQVVTCVRAGACKNMQSAKINWFDVVGIQVQTFSDDGWTYALALQAGARTGRPDKLTVYFTPPGESRATEELSLDMDGHLVTAELGPQPGEGVPSRDPYAVWQQNHKAYALADWHPSGKAQGEEFKPFWQKLADQVLIAAARVLAR